MIWPRWRHLIVSHKLPINVILSELATCAAQSATEGPSRDTFHVRRKTQEIPDAAQQAINITLAGRSFTPPLYKPRVAWFRYEKSKKAAVVGEKHLQILVRGLICGLSKFVGFVRRDGSVGQAGNCRFTVFFEGKELMFVKKTQSILLALVVTCAICAVPAFAVTLWDNGPLVTNPGGGAGGNDLSLLQNVTLGETTLGYGDQLASNNRVADDFTITGPDWVLDSVCLFAYQTGAPQSGTITGFEVRIWDGATAGTGNLLGTFSTLNSTGFSGTYRASETSPTNADRAIQLNDIDLGGLQLSAGTYWMDWAATGTLASGPWAPPVTYPGVVNGPNPLGASPNGQQSIGGAAFAAVQDGGSLTPDEFPFILKGTVVPEPGCLSLVCLAISGLMALRRR